MTVSDTSSDGPANMEAEQTRKQMQDDQAMTDDTGSTGVDLSKMDVAHLGGTEYRVLSRRNGMPTHYHVDVADGACECPDEEYNREPHECCGHLEKALVVHTTQLDAGEWAVRDLQTLVDRAMTLTETLQDSTNAVVHGEADSTTSEATDDGSGDDSTMPSGTPEEEHEVAKEAADKLRTAFADSDIEDMQVQAHAGMVWVQMGRDTPEDWPYPGGSDTFEVLLQNPDQVEYVYEAGDDYDAHELYDEKPGEYWTNAIDPTEVVDYINEVLG